MYHLRTPVTILDFNSLRLLELPRGYFAFKNHFVTGVPFGYTCYIISNPGFRCSEATGATLGLPLPSKTISQQVYDLRTLVTIPDYVTGVPKGYTCYEMVFEGNSSPEVAPVASEHRNPVL